MRTIDCGVPAAAGSTLATPDDVCRTTKNLCAVAPGTPIPPNITTTVTQQQQPDGTWRQLSVNCAATAGTAGPPPVTAAAVRQEVIRLLAPVPVGVAPRDGPTLVNMQTVFWADTAADRDLAQVTILGQQVAIRIHFARMDWDFGDGATGSAATPGAAYVDGVCSTAQCPGFFGHVYAVRSHVTATVAVSWTAEFAVAGAGWEPIPGSVTGPAASHPVTVVEARSVLVR